MVGGKLVKAAFDGPNGTILGTNLNWTASLTAEGPYNETIVECWENREFPQSFQPSSLWINDCYDGPSEAWFKAKIQVPGLIESSPQQV